MTGRTPVLTGQQQAKPPAKKTRKNETPEVAAGETAKATTPPKDIQKVTAKDGVIEIRGEQAAHDRVSAAMGSDCGDYQSLALTYLLNILPDAGKQGGDYTFETRAAVTMLEGIAPADTLEGMLAAQMVATHHMSMLTMRKAVHSSSPELRQANAHLANKFSRTFTAQLEALGKHRRKGEQVVKHVTVAEGGQAVIANTVNSGVPKP